MACPPGFRVLTCSLALATTLAAPRAAVAVRPIVPGTGELLTKVGDDFEDENWRFIHNHPKSSREIDKQLRYPTGFSKNRRWYEGAKRGQPDIIRRVPTPPEGLPGSKGALLLQTLRSGVPGTLSGKMEQDDLIVNVRGRMNGFIPMSWSPSIVVRVYLPPLETWERRTGIHFGFRGDAQAYVTEKGKGFFARTETKLKEYWPGIFIYFNSKYDSNSRKDAASFLFRAGPRGFDFPGPKIPQVGWWTLGISFTPDGQVHYYVSPGVDDLTENDYVTSRFPYSYRCERLNNFFFNVANRCDGRTWSTAWVIDDPAMYYIPRGRTVESYVNRTPRRSEADTYIVDPQPSDTYVERDPPRPPDTYVEREAPQAVEDDPHAGEAPRAFTAPPDFARVPTEEERESTSQPLRLRMEVNAYDDGPRFAR